MSPCAACAARLPPAAAVCGRVRPLIRLLQLVFQQFLSSIIPLLIRYSEVTQVKSSKTQVMSMSSVEVKLFNKLHTRLAAKMFISIEHVNIMMCPHIRVLKVKSVYAPIVADATIGHNTGSCECDEF